MPPMGLISIARTRVAGILSVLALVALTLSDFLLTGFWDRNAMVTSIVADMFVLVVGLAVVNELFASRSRRRWQPVADYALIELSRACRHVWVSLSEAIGLARREEVTLHALRDLLDREEDRIVELAEAAVRDADARRAFHEVVAEVAARAGDALTSWAPVLVETPDAAALSRYVELQAMLANLDLALWEEAEGRQPSLRGTGDVSWIGAQVRAVIVLGAALDRELREPAHELREAAS
jgi:hypothetical protein